MRAAGRSAVYHTMATLLKIAAVLGCLGVAASVVILLSIPLVSDGLEYTKTQFIISLLVFFCSAALSVVSVGSLWLSKG